MKKSIIVGFAAVTIGSSPPVFGQDNFFDRLGDRVENRLDRRGSRIDVRMERRGDRINRGLDRLGR